MQPYEVLARLNADSTVRGVSIRYLDNGRETDPQPLAGVTDPAFVAFAAAFSAAAIAERDAAQQAATAAAETAAQQLAAAQATITDLRTQLAAAQNAKLDAENARDTAVAAAARGITGLKPLPTQYLRFEVVRRENAVAPVTLIEEAVTAAFGSEAAKAAILGIAINTVTTLPDDRQAPIFDQIGTLTDAAGNELTPEQIMATPHGVRAALLHGWNEAIQAALAAKPDVRDGLIVSVLGA